MNINLEMSTKIHFDNDYIEKIKSLLEKRNVSYTICSDCVIRVFARDNKGFMSMTKFLKARGINKYFTQEVLSENISPYQIKGYIDGKEIDISGIRNLIQITEDKVNQIKIKNVDYFLLDSLMQYNNVLYNHMKGHSVVLYKDRHGLFCLCYCYSKENKFFEFMDNLFQEISKQDRFFEECNGL